MKILELIRLEEAEDGTIGVLKIQKEVFCFTLELTDCLNEASKSSIPAQQYQCLRIISARFKDTFQVMNVPGRTNILFHPGNTKDDTEGCILLGSEVGKLRGNRAVLNSGKTFKKFMTIMDDARVHLTIKEVY